MKTKAIHILMLLAAVSFGCIACSDETAPQPVPDGGGQLRIAYKIAGSSMTRAEEPGWGDEDKDGTDEWRENIITRLDLFVFYNDADQKLFKHISSAENFSEVDASSEQTFTQSELTYNDIANDNYIYYMVANCPQLADLQNITLTQLKVEMIETAIVLDEKQDVFVMDGEGVCTNSEDGQTITLSFNLARAAVKIRLAVFDANGTSIIGDCKFRLHNYVLTGTSVLEASEMYGKGMRQSLVAESEKLDWNGILKYKSQAVFYSYPNDWFDENLLAENGTFIEDDTYAKDDLIDETRQTYIMVDYKNNAYKVPVNFSIANDNDRTFSNDEEEIAYIKEIRDKYYRIKRNYIYDIKATIDVETGEIQIEHKIILVNAWNEKGEMDIIFGGKE